MNAEYALVTRQFKLEAVGGADQLTISLNVGTPYRHLTIWAKASIAAGDSIDVDYQAIFMGIDEGVAVTVIDANPTKVFQAATDELRPPTRVIVKHPDDAGPVAPATFEMNISNDAANPVTINFYMMAAAAPGGS